MDFSRLRNSLFLLFAIVATGTTSYVYLEDMTPFEAFYMTMITISTVGFSEIKPLNEIGRLVTVVIIISGLCVLTYTLGQVAQMFIEGELRKLLGRRKLEKSIAKLRDHYIICGYGRIGSTIARELKKQGIPLVVIEQNPQQIEILEAERILYISMDATEEDALEKAGLQYAKGLVTTVTSDSNNVFISLTAKGLRPDLFILARASDPKNETKLLRAGASRVVCPYLMGGRRMAEILRKPTVVDFIDQTMVNDDLGLGMEEALIAASSRLVGKTLVSSNLRQDFGVIVVAIKKASSRMIFNPIPSELLEAGDVIVVIGMKDSLAKMNSILH